ncbi:hypothetical protein T05_2204, partial [Trichinella murrelli]
LQTLRRCASCGPIFISGIYIFFSQLNFMLMISYCCWRENDFCSIQLLYTYHGFHIH